MCRRVVLVVALMVVVLAGTLVGVAAQSEDAAPTSFTGWVHGLGDDCGEGATFEVVGGVEQVRGYRCEGWMGTSDPRFTGTYVVVNNADTRRADTFQILVTIVVEGTSDRTRGTTAVG